MLEDTCGDLEQRRRALPREQFALRNHQLEAHISQLQGIFVKTSCGNWANGHVWDFLLLVRSCLAFSRFGISFPF